MVMNKVVVISKLLRPHIWRFAIYSLLLILFAAYILFIAVNGTNQYISIHALELVQIIAGVSFILWGLLCWASWYSDSPYWKNKDIPIYIAPVIKIFSLSKPGYFGLVFLLSWFLLAMVTIVLGVAGL
tara:strand:+ start:1415 stop:1798 length:384 start_codon:yes stop_codon:yes gene_type:complete